VLIWDRSRNGIAMLTLGAALLFGAVYLLKNPCSSATSAFCCHSRRCWVRGAVLLDAAQRLYAPGLTSQGVVITRVADEIAFSRSNGEIDADPAVLVAGTVVAADARRLHKHAQRAT